MAGSKSVPAPPSVHRTLPPGRKRKILALTTLGLAGLVAGLLSGCSGGSTPEAATTATAKSYDALAGNWKFTTGSAAGVTSLSGSLSISGTTVSGILHPLTTSCGRSSTIYPVSGSVDATNHLHLRSSTGDVLAISGTLAADQRSLLDPLVTVKDGSCSSAGSSRRVLTAQGAAAPTSATAQQFQPLTGNFSGSFTDTSGVVLPVAATLSQPTTPDSDGVYHLTGYATFPDTSCLNTPVITDSTVTGDSLQATYTDQHNGNAVAGTGTFSSDARTLTITNWILAGCGGDSGTGLLVRQSN